MGESVGLDLGAATSAAARLRDDEAWAAVVTTSELGLGSPSVRHRLESLAARAVGPEALPAVGVAVPTLDPDAQAEVEAAARDAFTDPLLILSPAAAAAWFCHVNAVPPDALLLVVEAEETRVAVTVVRARPRTPHIVARPSGRALSSGAPPVDAIDAVAAAMDAAGVVPADIELAVIVGSADWLEVLAAGINATTGVDAVVDPEPLAAVAYGAALLAGRSDGFGVGTALALGAPVVGAGAAAGVAAAPAAVPPPAGAAGSGLGAALRDIGQAKDAPTEPIGEGAGGVVGGIKAPPSSPSADGGGDPKRPPSRLPEGGLKRALILAPAVAAVVIVGAVSVRSCAEDPDTTTLATSSAPEDPGDGGTSSTGPDGGSSGPNGSDKGGVLDPTSSETTSTSSSTTSTTRRPTTPTTPTTPSTPGVPPSDPSPSRDTTPPAVTNLFRSVGDISADLGECQYPTTTVLSATITDDSGVAGATITWSTKGHSGSLTMTPTQGTTWSATLGPIFDQTLTTSDSAPVDWSVQAFDAAGNQASATAGGRGAVTFHGCVGVIG